MRIYPSVKLDQVVVSGTLHLATVATGAMFFHDSIDFSPYASSRYRVQFFAGTTFVGEAFCGAIGGGEALDPTNLLASLNFASGWSGLGGGTAVDADSFSTPAAGGMYKALTTVGALYKSEIKGSTTASGVRLMATNTGGANITYASALNTAAEYQLNWSNTNLYFVNASAGTTDITVATSYAQRVTDIPVTGLKLLAADKTTQSMISQPGVSSANAITRVLILEDRKVSRPL
jgi:hypothetical protein